MNPVSTVPSNPTADIRVNPRSKKQFDVSSYVVVQSRKPQEEVRTRYAEIIQNINDGSAAGHCQGRHLA